MRRLNVVFQKEPNKIYIEDLPDGKSRVILRIDITEHVRDTKRSHLFSGSKLFKSMPETYWNATEVYMECPTVNRPTEEEILADFDTWVKNIGNWSNDVQADTVETLRNAITDTNAKVDMLTECILEMSVTMYSE